MVSVLDLSIKLRLVVKLSLKMYDCRAGEPPDEPALAPLADRFLFAAELSPVSRSARLKLLDRKSDEDEPITQESIAALVSPPFPKDLPYGSLRLTSLR